MKIDKQYKQIPYYKPTNNFRDQLKESTQRRKTKTIPFLMKKVKNTILMTLAFNFPINSWRVRFHRWRGVNIGKNVYIGLKVTLDQTYPDYIFIEDNVAIAEATFILTHSNPYPHFQKSFDSFIAPVVIREGVEISIKAVILPGVEIGKYSIVASGAIVTKDVPEKTLVGGVPAKKLKDIKV